MYEQIAANRRNTLILASVMVFLLMALGYFFGVYLGSPYAGLIIAVALATVMLSVSYYSGAQIIMSLSNAKEIKKSDDPQLFNVVEELSIAAGLKAVPRVFLIHDPAPNAFATGRGPEHAAVAITTGLREKLNRDELQGVMAHELSHILNRDILYMMMLAVMVGTIAMLADLFWRSMWYSSWTRGGRSRSGRDKGQGQAILIVVGMILAVVAPLLATLIQLAASRQREYLADASAAKLTRYPQGLASALKKIASDQTELKSATRGTAHLFIVNPFKKAKEFSTLFDSHPPMAERVKRLLELR